MATRQGFEGLPISKGLKFGLVKELLTGYRESGARRARCTVCESMSASGSETGLGSESRRAISDCTKGAQRQGTVRRCSVSYGRAVVPNQWERLEAPFVGNVEEQAAGLAMNGVGVVTLQPAGGARIADLVGPHERL